MTNLLIHLYYIFRLSDDTINHIYLLGKYWWHCGGIKWKHFSDHTVRKETDGKPVDIWYLWQSWYKEAEVSDMLFFMRYEQDINYTNTIHDEA